MWTAADMTALRKAYGETQLQFCERLGIAIDTVKSWELGRRRPGGCACTVLDLLTHALQKKNRRELGHRQLGRCARLLFNLICEKRRKS